MEAEKDSGRRLVCSFFFFFPNLYLVYDRSIFFVVVSCCLFFPFLYFARGPEKKYNKLHAKGSKQLTPPVPCEAQSLRHLSGEVVAGKGVEGGLSGLGVRPESGGLRGWALGGGGRRQGMRGVAGDSP